MSNTTVSTALVMDDNFHNRYIFRIALEEKNYQVEEAENGSEGLKILEEKSFNLLVLDLQMPLIDGITVLRELHKKPLHRNMRLLVVTANAHMATGEVTNLADYVMYKPINVMEFAEFSERLKGVRMS